MSKKITIKDIEKAYKEVLENRTKEEKAFDNWFEWQCKVNPNFAKEVTKEIKRQLCQVLESKQNILNIGGLRIVILLGRTIQGVERN